MSKNFYKDWLVYYSARLITILFDIILNSVLHLIPTFIYFKTSFMDIPIYFDSSKFEKPGT